MEKTKLNYSFISLLKHHINGGVILLIIAVLAMIIANTAWSDEYFRFWGYPMRLQIGEYNLLSHGGEPLSLMGFINDALMAIFFFYVGLEIKRELLIGELSDVKKAMLPISAAIGGMLFPMAIYYFITMGTEAERGLAIPMATDIAFSLGILNLFGKRVPLGLKIFLTALAVVDDIGGILVIALFYSSHISVGYLLASAAVLLVLVLGNATGVRKKYFYFIGFLFLWYFFMQSGIHATIAGVIAAFTVPATPQLQLKKYISRIHENIQLLPEKDDKSLHWSKYEIEILKSVESASDKVISPLQSFEDRLKHLVNYLIIPIFAFANAGIAITATNGIPAIGTVTMAVALGLVLGKLIGIFVFTAVPIVCKWIPMPNDLSYLRLAGISLLGGIGFTVSLFIANLSFGEYPELLNQAKLGVLLGTVISGIIGFLVLRHVLPRNLAE